MRLGLYHTAMLDLEPEALMLWLQQHEFSDLELHGGPRYRGIDWSLVAQGDASLRDIAERYGIKIWDIMDGSLNFLDADRARRQMKGQGQANIYNIGLRHRGNRFVIMVKDLGDVIGFC